MKPTGCLGLLAFVLVGCSAEKPVSPPASTPVASSASSAATPGAAIASPSSAPERQPEDKAEEPLCNAVREGDAARTKELLGGGADPLTICADLVSISVSSGVISGFETMPALLVAASHETPTLIDLLLAAQAPVDARNDDGQTALMVAARGARVRVVKALLSAGANVNERDHQGRTALMLVSDEPSLSETLLSAVGREQEAQEAVRKRMASGIETVEALLAAGADVNAVDNNGRTALVLARVGGRTHIVTALSQANTDAPATPAADTAPRLPSSNTDAPEATTDAAARIAEALRIAREIKRRAPDIQEVQRTERLLSEPAFSGLLREWGAIATFNDRAATDTNGSPVGESGYPTLQAAARSAKTLSDPNHVGEFQAGRCGVRPFDRQDGNLYDRTAGA